MTIVTAASGDYFYFATTTSTIAQDNQRPFFITSQLERELSNAFPQSELFGERQITNRFANVHEITTPRDSARNCTSFRRNSFSSFRSHSLCEQEMRASIRNAFRLKVHDCRENSSLTAFLINSQLISQDQLVR